MDDLCLLDCRPCLQLFSAWVKKLEGSFHYSIFISALGFFRGVCLELAPWLGNVSSCGYADYRERAELVPWELLRLSWGSDCSVKPRFCPVNSCLH